jgi:putative drug exporter of the RND superfamily
LFGLSMDYEVFLLTRIQEEYDISGDNSASVIKGLQQTGGMITSAALLMIIVTSAFAFTSIIFVKALGLGTAIAVLIDATLIRAILVPATMHLMGKWNWWSPKWLRSR